MFDENIPKTVACAVGQVLNETVGVLNPDSYQDHEITYPLTGEALRLCRFKYDLHVWKPGYRWVYSSSVNRLTNPLLKQAIRVVAKNGAWRVVKAATSVVVACGPKERISAPLTEEEKRND